MLTVIYQTSPAKNDSNFSILYVSKKKAGEATETVYYQNWR